MKNLLILSIVLLGFTVDAQTPKSGAIISLNEYEYEMAEGETIEIPAQLVRSSRFKKGKIDGLTIQQKKGLTTTVEVVEDMLDLYLLSIRLEAGSNLSGSFPIVLKAEGRDAYQVKQTMIMIKVRSEATIVSTNE